MLIPDSFINVQRGKMCSSIFLSYLTFSEDFSYILNSILLEEFCFLKCHRKKPFYQRANNIIHSIKLTYLLKYLSSTLSFINNWRLTGRLTIYDNMIEVDFLGEEL